MEYVDQLLNDMANIRDRLGDLGQKYLSDKTIPLEDRWSIFVKLVKADVLPNETYGDGEIDMLGDNVSLYDDFYIERHETTTYPDFYERITEDGEYPVDKVDAWRERVLAKRRGSFTYDW